MYVDKLFVNFSGGTLINVTGSSLNSVYYPVITLSTVITHLVSGVSKNIQLNRSVEVTKTVELIETIMYSITV